MLSSSADRVQHEHALLWRKISMVMWERCATMRSSGAVMMVLLARVHTCTAHALSYQAHSWALSAHA